MHYSPSSRSALAEAELVYAVSGSAIPWAVRRRAKVLVKAGERMNRLIDSSSICMNVASGQKPVTGSTEG